MKRIFPFFMILNLAAILSCESPMLEQAYFPEMIVLYCESKTLTSVKVDSVARFSNKVTALVGEMRKANRDDLAASWLQMKTVDISHGHSSLERLLGKLYLEDENAPVKGLDNAEARALIIFRCFVKMKVKGEV